MFIADNFVLQNKTAESLYHDYAEDKAIIDFHNHLSPKEIAEDIKFSNLSEIWLGGDHYKWRAMRINGINEKYCTGSASDYEKFQHWAATVPYTVNNPLYHWTHLELARYFDINDLLSPKTAEHIYKSTEELLQSDDFSTRQLLKKMKVEMVGTTDDPADSLEHHKALKEEGYDIKVLPTFRADQVLNTENPSDLSQYLLRLGSISNININKLDDLLEALEQRHAYFHSLGCRLSDSGQARFYFAEYTHQQVDEILSKLIKGEQISSQEQEKYKTCLMAELAALNHKRGWTQQFHVGAIRNNSTRQFKALGADTGWDSIGDAQSSVKMSLFLNLLDSRNQLAKTILYNLNPSDNEMMLTMCGNFCDGSTPGKVQYGAAWWFLDQQSGMEKHLRDLSALGLLSRFVGMVTDSRSFLSFPRHEYFRRIVCNYIGSQVEKGLIPNDETILKQVVEGISYNNAKSYFNF